FLSFSSLMVLIQKLIFFVHLVKKAITNQSPLYLIFNLCNCIYIKTFNLKKFKFNILKSSILFQKFIHILFTNWPLLLNIYLKTFIFEVIVFILFRVRIILYNNIVIIHILYNKHYFKGDYFSCYLQSLHQYWWHYLFLKLVK